MARPHIVLVGRELYPFVGGGIAPIIAANAQALSDVADVTLLTTHLHREAYERLIVAGPLYGPGVEVEFVTEPGPEPGARGAHYSHMHAWSSRVFEHLAERFGHRPPDLIEFCDYLAEGFVTMQAKHTAEPFLSRTIVAVRMHTSAEMASVLNGRLRTDMETEAVFDAERFCLRHADRLLYSGGDVMETYRRYYGPSALASASKVLEAFHVDYVPAPGDEPAAEGPLRVLFLGRLERRKGVQNLMRAVNRIGYRDWRLTLLGGDTDTGPLGTSMFGQLELQAAGDERVVFAKPVPRAEVGAMIHAHDVVVVPSLWECWPNVAREAFLYNRPVLATPVGGLVDMVEPDRSGWLTRDTSVAALVEALEELIEQPQRAHELIRAGGPRQALERLHDADRTRREYLELLGSPPSPRSRPARRPLVSIVVPYFKMHEHVRETIESIEAQSWPRIETVLVNDGSYRREDAIVEALAEEFGFTVVGQPNSGLSAARNLGVSQSHGTYVLPLDPDDMLAPDFVERCVDAMERHEDLAYVATWSTYVNERSVPLRPEQGYRPYGNWSRLVDRENVAGAGTALIRRRWFDLGYRYNVDLTSYEDWFLYRELARAGHFGGVIPRKLFLYRVREASMLRSYGMANMTVLHDEMRALLREGEMRWEPQSA